MIPWTPKGRNMSLRSAMARWSTTYHWCSSKYAEQPGLASCLFLRRVGYESGSPSFHVETYEIFRGSMPNFFIRVSKVVRLSPKRAAAPFGPPTRPLVSFRIRTILSCSSKFLGLA